MVLAARIIATVLLVALWIADFGFDALAKPAGNHAYYILLAVALGVDTRQLRETILSLLNRKGEDK